MWAWDHRDKQTNMKYKHRAIPSLGKVLSEDPDCPLDRRQQTYKPKTDQ